MVTFHYASRKDAGLILDVWQFPQYSYFALSGPPSLSSPNILMSYDTVSKQVCKVLSLGKYLVTIMFHSVYLSVHSSSAFMR